MEERGRRISTGLQRVKTDFPFLRHGSSEIGGRNERCYRSTVLILHIGADRGRSRLDFCLRIGANTGLYAYCASRHNTPRILEPGTRETRFDTLNRSRLAEQRMVRDDHLQQGVLT